MKKHTKTRQIEALKPQCTLSDDARRRLAELEAEKEEVRGSASLWLLIDGLVDCCCGVCVCAGGEGRMPHAWRVRMYIPSHPITHSHHHHAPTHPPTHLLINQPTNPPNQVASALRAGEKEMGRLEARVKALQAAIIDVGGPKLKAAQGDVKRAMGGWDNGGVVDDWLMGGGRDWWGEGGMDGCGGG